MTEHIHRHDDPNRLGEVPSQRVRRDGEPHPLTPPEARPFGLTEEERQHLERGQPPSGASLPQRR
jgi:hypothetical protein